MTDLVGKRKDSMAFISADQSDVVNIAQSYTQTTNTEGFFNALGSSSYVAYDSGYTKMYDKYNDLYRWVPLNGHIAGLCAFTDAVEDPWWSPAGMNRGQIRSSVSLAFNPKQQAVYSEIAAHGLPMVLAFILFLIVIPSIITIFFKRIFSKKKVN
mgnify:CR=1 FL=1